MNRDQNADQLAAEAAAEITRIAKLVALGCKPHTTVKAIIQAAIEKATERIKDERDDYQHLLIQELDLRQK